MEFHLATADRKDFSHLEKGSMLYVQETFPFPGFSSFCVFLHLLSSWRVFTAQWLGMVCQTCQGFLAPCLL